MPSPGLARSGMEGNWSGEVPAPGGLPMTFHATHHATQRRTSESGRIAVHFFCINVYRALRLRTTLSNDPADSPNRFASPLFDNTDGRWIISVSTALCSDNREGF